jgi:hypothetical protein
LLVAAPQDGDDVARWDVSFRQQDEGVIEEIGDLA